VSEVIHGAPSRFQDPARFAFAHGGKDGHPFPVPLKVYDETLAVLRRAVEQAKLGNAERLDALRRLDQQARLAERAAEGASFDGLIRCRLGGRTVFGASRAPIKKKSSQLTLPGLDR
jgi:hypothetical protein